MRAWAIWGALWLLGGAANAQTVYRCGPDGRVYSQTPCPGGKAVDVSDERSPEQRAVALQRASADQERGDRLERERLQREANQPAAAGRIQARPVPTAESASAPKPKVKQKKRKAANKADDFKAVTPAKPPKRKS